MDWGFFASCNESDDAEFNAPYIEGWHHFFNSAEKDEQTALANSAFMYPNAEHKAMPFFPGRGVRWAIYAKGV
jgi:hypothetical protein